MFFKACRPLAQAIGRSQLKELKFLTKGRIGLQINQSTDWRGLQRPGATVTTRYVLHSLHLLLNYLDWGVSSINFKKIKKFIMTKTMRLAGPLTLVQKRQRSPNILRQLRQRQPATSLGQQQAQLHGRTMPPMSFKKQLVFVTTNNKGTKKWTCGRAPTKVAVARQGRHAENSVVHSQARTWRSLTKRCMTSLRIIRAS